jgi:hypothetical protein
MTPPRFVPAHLFAAVMCDSPFTTRMRSRQHAGWGGAVIGVCILAGASCGGNTTTAPATSTTPPAVQVGGTWQGSYTVTGVSGGECAGAMYSANLGRSLDTMSWQWNVYEDASENGLASLNAAVTWSSLNCPYAGLASTGITLSFASDEGCGGPGPGVQALQCADGSLRLLTLGDDHLTGTVTGTTATGTGAQTWNVSNSNINVGTLKITYTFSMTNAMPRLSGHE